MNSERNPQTHAQRAASAQTAGDQARHGQNIIPVDERPANRTPVITGWQDCFNLLALAAAFDGRQRGQFEAEAWFQVFEGQPIDDVRAAITAHYRRSTYPVMPANIIDILEEGTP